MSDMPHVASLGLDPDWVASAVGRAGVGVGVPEAAFDGFVGTGQMSQVARFTLQWSGGDGPTSTLVKLPSAVERTSEMGFRRGPYRRECEFYRTVSEHVDVAAPRTYEVHFDASARDFAIVMEDVNSHVAGDQLGSTAIDDIARALDQAAVLHAGAWGKTHEAAFAVYREDRDAEVARTQRTFPRMVETVLERWGDTVAPEVFRFVEGLSLVIGEWRRRRSEPRTLAHGDFRPDNMLFPRTDPNRPVVVVDWQLATVGLGAIDVAFLIGGSLDVASRREHEPRLLRSYHDAMEARGVTVDTATFETEYALSTVHGVVVAIGAAAMVDRTERGEALLSLMLDRHARHAIDWDAIAVVET